MFIPNRIQEEIFVTNGTSALDLEKLVRNVLDTPDGEILVVGGRNTNFARELREHPRFIFWDSTDPDTKRKTKIPVRVHLVILTRFIGHGSLYHRIVNMLPSEVRMVNFPFSTGQIRNAFFAAIGQPQLAAAVEKAEGDEGDEESESDEFVVVPSEGGEGPRETTPESLPSHEGGAGESEYPSDALSGTRFRVRKGDLKSFIELVADQILKKHREGQSVERVATYFLGVAKEECGIETTKSSLVQAIYKLLRNVRMSRKEGEELLTEALHNDLADQPPRDAIPHVSEETVLSASSERLILFRENLEKLKAFLAEISASVTTLEEILKERLAMKRRAEADSLRIKELEEEIERLRGENAKLRADAKKLSKLKRLFEDE